MIFIYSKKLYNKASRNSLLVVCLRRNELISNKKFHKTYLQKKSYKCENTIRRYLGASQVYTKDLPQIYTFLCSYGEVIAQHVTCG